MEATAFFEKKISLNAKDLNKIGKSATINTLVLEKIREKLEDKCSEHGFVLPGTLELLSRSMGYFEPARFTGDAIYYVKAQGQVLYPADGVRVVGEVIRKNKMGLYVVYRNALRIQVPRDLHLTDELADMFEDIAIGDTVEVELKKSLFQINDPFILTNGIFISKKSEATGVPETKEAEEGEEEEEAEAAQIREEEGEEAEARREEESEEEEAQSEEEEEEEEAEQGQVVE
jgi:hypothetical protein